MITEKDDFDELFNNYEKIDENTKTNTNIETQKVKPLQFINDNKLNYFNCVLWYDVLRGIKSMICPEKWNESKFENPKCIQSTKDKKYNNNGLGLIMGQKINGKYLICLDLDNKEGIKNSGIYYKNGVQIWKELTKLHNYTTNTIIAKTPSKGFHFFYLIDEENLNLFESSFTGLYINDEWYNIDMKLKNQFIFVEPTYYYKDNQFLKYEFKHTDISKLEEVPDFLLQIMKKNLDIHRCHINMVKKISNKNKTESKEVKYIVEEARKIEKATSEELIIIKEILNLLNSHRIKDERTSWLPIGESLYNLGCSYELWDEWSKGVDKYTLGECKKRYEGFKKRHIVNSIHTLLYFLKNEVDHEKYNIIYKKVYNIDKWKNKRNSHLSNYWSIDKIYDDGKEYNVKNYNLQFLCDKNKKITKIKIPKMIKNIF
ncbi:putative primase-polymerase [Bodo saltans virus]|uniref:Primase-polymerase n=1 Tax=Bodo saltans virus TaxID=2024608 RepID=A0A2H4UWH7_9VIRU|nr:putative primase-polymerase [Bodo saltans virus]ATZ81254.1 putative primase-polymerase [Bodo saltans virus]